MTTKLVYPMKLQTKWMLALCGLGMVSIVFFGSCNRSSSIDPKTSEAFIKYIGGGKSQMAGRILLGIDGGYVIVGSTNSLKTTDDFDQYIVKLDAFGNRVWARTFGGMGNDYANDIKPLPDGSGYLMLGDRTFPNSSAATNWSSLFNIRRIGLNGDSLASYFYGDTLNARFPRGENRGRALDIVGNDVFFAGNASNLSPFKTITSASDNSDVYIGKIRLDGSFVNKTVFGYETSEDLANIFLLNNRYYFGFNSPRIQLTARSIVLATGSQVDIRPGQGIEAMDNPRGSIDSAQLDYAITSLRDMKFTLDQSALVITGGINSKPYVYLVDKELKRITKKLSLSNFNLENAEGKAIVPLVDGSYALVGNFYNPTTNSTDIFLAKILENGTVAWTKNFGGVGEDSAVDVKVTADGGFIICSNIAFGTDNIVIGIIKTKSDGTVN